MVETNRLKKVGPSDGEFKPFELYNENAMTVKVKADYQAFTYLDEVESGLFGAIRPMLDESYQILLSAAKETNRNVGHSIFKDAGTHTQEDHKAKFKTKLQAFMKNHYVGTINKGIPADVVKTYVTNKADSGTTPQEGALPYAVFEQKVQEFIYNSLLGKLFPVLVQRTIDSYSDSYFETFDNTIDQKMEAMKKLSIKMSVIVAPKLYCKVTALYPKDDQPEMQAHPGESIQLFEKKTN